MFKLDNEFLQSLGLGGLPVDEKNKLLQMIYERLEMNVGMRLAEKMTDQQLDEFEAFIDQNDEAGALKWLESNFPNYKDVVAEELEKLKVEVTAAAPQILAAQTGGQQPAIMNDPMMPGVPQPAAMQAPQPGYQQPMQQPQPAYQPPAPAPSSQQPFYDQPMQPHMQPAQAPQTPGFTPQTPPQQPAPSFDQPQQPQPAPIQPAYPSFDQPAAQPAPAQTQQPQPSFDPAQDNPSAQPIQPAPGFTLPPADNLQPAPGFQSQAPTSTSQQFTPPPAGGFTPGQ